MSEYASEEIVIPSHVDWLQPLKDLVKKITAQDGEQLCLEALAQDQYKAIDSLLLLVKSLDIQLRFYEHSVQSDDVLIHRHRDTTIKYRAKKSSAALLGLGIDLSDYMELR